MNVPAVSPPVIRPIARTVGAAWRGITRVELLTTFLLGCALNLFHLVSGLAFGAGIRGLPIIFISDQIKVFPLLLTVVVADRVTGKDPDRRGAYALAVVVGAAAGAAAAVSTTTILVQMVLQRAASVRIGFMLYICFELLMLGGVTVWVIMDRRRAARARARMHGAELERIAAEKHSIESDLQAMQARVEPQFLFNTLAQVKRLYEHDPALGERMLDELIAYLRAAMPKMRDTSSTVGQEIELARAYLGIVRLRLGERLAFEIDTLEQVADARMPPMMLLPLVDHAIVHGLERSQSQETIRLTTEVTQGRLRLAIAGSGAGFLREAQGDGIASIRERLDALFGADALLVLRARGDGGTEAVLEVPYERI